MITIVRNWYKHDAGHIVLGVIMLCCLIGSLPRIYATDEVQYYAWLRSIWFDHDVDFRNEYETFAQLNPQSGIDKSLLLPNRIRPATGLYGNIAPVGSALLWAPWFIAIDGLMHLLHDIGVATHIPADGYSWPYQRAVCYASALYAFLGLHVSRRLVQHWFGTWESTLATIGIWLATPLVYYMTIQMPFAHANGFFVSSCFVWLWWKSSQETSSWRIWALLGVCAGSLYLVREQLILLLILPAFTVIYTFWQQINGAIPSYWYMTVRKLVVCAICICMTLLPQFIAYWAVNGTPRPASEVSSKLNMCSPHALDTLVDFDPSPAQYCNVPPEPVSVPAWSRGALVWSPIIALALIGLGMFVWSNPLIGSAMLCAFALQVWINGAFGTTWHLSGAFGFRRYIECSPFFIIGLAQLLTAAQSRVARYWLIGVVTVLILWNFGLMINATIFNTETQLRRGLTWPNLWEWQRTLPVRLWEQSHNLFDRCRLIKNSC